MPTPGLVVSVRINPTDAMSVIDILDAVGVPKENLSFAQGTKIALSSLLESARQAGTIPRREGFEYLEMLAPFKADSYASRGAKLKLANELAKPPTENNVPVPQLDRAKQVRLDELLFKHQQDPDNMGKEELQELTELLEQSQ